MKAHADNRTLMLLQLGARFNRLTVIGEEGVNRHRQRLFKFRCICGTEKTILGYDVVRGKARSCGCFEREQLSNRNRKSAIKLRSLRESPKNAENALFLAYKGQARRRKIDFSLTCAEFSTLIHKICWYCGCEPSNRFRAYKKKTFQYEVIYTGIDRKDPAGGYTIENSVPCCKVCNIAKHTMSESEFYMWFDRVQMHRSKRSFG